MAIKTRISLAMAAVLTVATVAIGLIAIQAVTSTMRERVDDRLWDFMRRGPQPADVSASGDVDQSLPLAVFYIRGDGARYITPAGYQDEPLPLPNISDALESPGEITPVSSASGTGYRALAQELRGGAVIVVASPTSEIDSVRRDMYVIMAFVVICVLLLSVAAAWWISRVGLRPVDDMIDDAVAVSNGQLDRDIFATRAHTELGRLAAALNRMVSTLVSAITQRDTEHARLKRFVADASHELRTPLAAVGGYTELYRQRALEPGPELDKAMDRIHRENTRLTALVDDLTTLTRVEDTGVDDDELVDLGLLASEVVGDAAVVDAHHPVTLRADDPVAVYGDEARLRQVLTNLVTNARVHTAPHTPITVEVTARDGTAVAVVADEGEGIDPRHHDKLFDRFYRVDQSRSRNTGGSGLGLAIVSSIVEAHGGHIALRSAEGQGTTVELRLPLADVERHAGRPAE